MKRYINDITPFNDYFANIIGTSLSDEYVVCGCMAEDEDVAIVLAVGPFPEAAKAFQDAFADPQPYSCFFLIAAEELEQLRETTH